MEREVPRYLSVEHLGALAVDEDAVSVLLQEVDEVGHAVGHHAHQTWLAAAHRDVGFPLELGQPRSRLNKMKKSPRVLKRSFSTVWTAKMARCSEGRCIFRDLQDLHTFAPLSLQNFRRRKKHHKFCYFFACFLVFNQNFTNVSLNCDV